MERETGIEPATNSLEGCDSTTELLPHFPSHVLTSAGRASGAYCLLLRAGSLPKPAVIACGACDGNAAGCQPKSARRNERWLVVAREGIEPSKPLGRQIYSLLRLTASLPRQSLCVLESVYFGAYLADRNAQYRWSWRRDLNPRPADYKSAALPD